MPESESVNGPPPVRVRPPGETRMLSSTLAGYLKVIIGSQMRLKTYTKNLGIGER